MRTKQKACAPEGEKKMAHLFKKATKGGSNKPKEYDSKSSFTKRPVSPICPPPPDFTHFSNEEIAVLSDVLRRQEQFENEEKQRIGKIHDEIEKFEETVQRQASTKGKLKNIDLRLCRLCFKTKFADGIGRVCYDCRKRVCQRCGSYSSNRWNPKKNKSVRGRWRCNMCQMKRDYFCKTGIWYHGNKATFSINTEIIRQKTLISDLDFSNTEHLSRSFSFSSSTQSTNTDTELINTNNTVETDSSKEMQSRGGKGRRQSMPVVRYEIMQDDIDSEVEDINDDKHNEHLGHQRHKKHNRKHGRKLVRHYSSERADSDSDHYVSRREYIKNVDTLDLPHSDYHHRLSLDSASGGSRRTSAESISGSGSRRASGESVSGGSSVSVYFRPGDNEKIAERSKRNNLSRLTKQDSYHSSSSSLLTESVPSNAGRRSLSASPDSRRSDNYRSGTFGRPSDHHSSRNIENDRSRSPPVHKSRHRRGIRAFNENENKRYKVCNLLPPESPARRLHENRRNSSGSCSTHRYRSSPVANDDLRPNISLSKSALSNLRPREILLYRDKMDQSRRFAGLGMRVSGGKLGPDGKLGAFVTLVETDGPADSYGIKAGDQILLWNGKSLLDTTFEEAKEIMRPKSEFVQLLVVHHEERNTIKGSLNITPEESATEQEDIAKPDIITPPDSLPLNRPKRRMLPKTPIEIKKEDRKLSGRIEFGLKYTAEDECLSVTLVKAEELMAPDKLDVKDINPVAAVYLLPDRSAYPPYETIPQYNTSAPSWNETFNILDLPNDEMLRKAIEVTLWSIQDFEDEFLGEVLLDLNEAVLDNSTINYELHDHDENSSPLPVRKRKESCSDVTTTSLISPVTSTADTSSWSTSPCLHSSQNLANSKDAKDPRKILPDTPAHDKVKYLLMHGKHNPGREHLRLDCTHSVPTSPQASPDGAKEFALYGNSFDHRDSMTQKMKKKVFNAVSKVSSSLSVGDSRQSLVEKEKQVSGRSHSANELLDTFDLHDNPSPVSRRSTASSVPPGEKPAQFSRTNSNASFYDDDDDDRSSFENSADRPVPEGDDITSLLGSSQVPPKPSSENLVCGDIKLGFMVSKGQLEIDIHGVTGLLKGSENCPPDTYVKTYLVGGTKVIQKKKTQVIKASYEPMFRRKIKYSACNIHGRAIKVILWARHGTFDKKQCLGEVVIKLDGLNLSQHTTSWYKMFEIGATDYGSNESLSMW